MTEADTPETKSKKRKNGEAKKQVDAKMIKLDSSNGKADDEESSDDDDRYLPIFLVGRGGAL